MRAAGVFIAILLIVTSEAAAPRRDKRQLVPLFSSCDVYSTCASPAVCLSGQCQCVQPYVATQSACVSAYPRLLSPAYNPGILPTYLQPQQAFLHYPVQSALAVPVAQHPLAYYPPQVGEPSPIPKSQQLRPIPGQQTQHVPYLPETQPVVPLQDEPLAAVHRATSTANFPRQYDAPYIAYPGEFCQVPQTVCVGGSICVNDVCTCRRGEDSVNGQCEKIEVPLVADTTPGMSSITISTGATIVPTTVGVTTPPTISSATTIMSSTSPFAVSVTDTTTATTTTTTTLATSEINSTTTPSAKTTTISATTTIPAVARDVTIQSSPYRCVSCCQPNPVNCRPHVINVNFLYPPQNRRLNKGCQNNFQCPRGLSCLQGLCR